MTIRVLAFGDAAVLVDVGDPGGVLSVRAAVARQPGVLETVPAARTVLVRYDPALVGPEQIRQAAVGAPAMAAPGGPAEPVRLSVVYDGPDLVPLADELGIDADELVRRHVAGTHTVAFCGFSPGFAYLTGLDPSLHAPRLAEPRTSVPAGSVAVAGEYSGVYPRASPGGWRLLGRTDAPLWDTGRTPPALLTPGTAVQFVPA